MNEKIKEMMQQAGTDISGKWMSLEQVEKLSELIVKGCAHACINMGNDYEVKSAGQYQAELFAFAIKQHFGVKE